MRGDKTLWSIEVRFVDGTTIATTTTSPISYEPEFVDAIMSARNSVSFNAIDGGCIICPYANIVYIKVKKMEEP